MYRKEKNKRELFQQALISAGSFGVGSVVEWEGSCFEFSFLTLPPIPIHYLKRIENPASRILSSVFSFSH